MKAWQWLLIGAFVLIAIGGGVVAINPVTGYSDIVRRFAEAIATAEGYFVSGSLPNRRNNPGDISDAGGVKSYNTPEEGWNALYHQVSLMFNGGSAFYNASMTIYQVAQKYAEDWQPWATNVAAYLGVSPNTTLADLV